MPPIIHEAYRDFRPPAWIRPSLTRLLASVPEGYLSGLGAIVLTDRAAVGRGKTGRVAGRKHDRNACLGFYRHRYGGDPAAIEILVDNSLAGQSRSLMLFGLGRDWALGRVLYHEIGHHLDQTLGAAAPHGEAAAEDWQRRLMRLHFRRQYWWLRPFARAIKPITRLALRRARRKAGARRTG